MPQVKPLTYKLITTLQFNLQINSHKNWHIVLADCQYFFQGYEHLLILKMNGTLFADTV